MNKTHFHYFSKEEGILKPGNDFKQHIKHISPIERILRQQKQALDRPISRECKHVVPVLVYEDGRHGENVAVPRVEKTNVKGGDSNEVINWTQKYPADKSHEEVHRSGREVNRSAQDYLRVEPCMHTSDVSSTSPWTTNARNENTLDSAADSHS